MCNNNTKIIGLNKNPNTSSVKDNVKPIQRQWTKWLSNTIALGLVNSNEKSELRTSYWRTYQCTDVISFDDTAKGKATYCKYRWCYTCNRIRTAKLINEYLPQLKQFKDAHFVTLTRPTCTADELPNRIKEMNSVFAKITTNCRKKYYPIRGTKEEYKGLKKLECTLRPNAMYHPHFHLLVNTKEQADYILKHWLRLNKDADAKAQDVRKADENSYKELFKYFTKLNNGKRKKGEALSLDYKRLDIVFCAMKGTQVFRSFGQLRIVKEDFDDTDLMATTQLTDEYANRLFSWIDKDWIDKVTGEMLIGKEIPKNVQNLIPPTIEQKEAIEQTNYLPPLTEFATTSDAFDLGDTPTPYDERNDVKAKEIETIKALMESYRIKSLEEKSKKKINTDRVANPKQFIQIALEIATE